jgi:AcrR family transcriptional regulator
MPARKKLNSPIQEKPSLREQIMDAATIRFAEFGYAGCSMRHIAVDLGITATAIYYNFKDKETLYLEVCRRRFDLAAKQIAHAFAGGLPAEDQILGFLERLVALLEEDSIYFRIVQLQLLERSVEEVRLLSTMAFIPQYKVLQKLIRQISPAANCAQCAFNLYALALGYAQFKSLRKAFPKEINIGQTPAEIARLIFTSVLPAIRSSPVKKPARIVKAPKTALATRGRAV